MDKEKLQNEILQELIYPKKIPAAFFADMSPGEFTLIAAFTAYGKHITVNELASNINVSVPAVSRTLKNLENRRLIQRKINLNCRRTTFVTITKKGKELFEINRKKITDMLDKVMDALTVDEILTAIKFHQKVESILQRECENYTMEEQEGE